MIIELIDVINSEPDLGTLVEYKIPEFKLHSFINIDTLLYDEKSVDDYIYDGDYCGRNKIAITEYILSQWESIHHKLVTNQMPNKNQLPTEVTDFIWQHLGEMGFISYDDCNGECKAAAKPFTEALEHFPSLNDVITIGVTFPVCNDDVITTYGNAACYINWWGM